MSVERVYLSRSRDCSNCGGHIMFRMEEIVWGRLCFCSEECLRISALQTLINSMEGLYEHNKQICKALEGIKEAIDVS